MLAVDPPITAAGELWDVLLAALIGSLAGSIAGALFVGGLATYFEFRRQLRRQRHRDSVRRDRED